MITMQAAAQEADRALMYMGLDPSDISSPGVEEFRRLAVASVSEFGAGSVHQVDVERLQYDTRMSVFEVGLAHQVAQNILTSRAANSGIGLGQTIANELVELLAVLRTDFDSLSGGERLRGVSDVATMIMDQNKEK